jgi:hypothetical protein
VRVGSLVVVLVGLLALVGCSTGASSTSPDVGSEPTVTVAPTTVTVAPTTVAVTTTAKPAAPVTTESKAERAAEMCTVPNVVGMVHQDAQDTMQRAGLYILMEEDATGQGRMLVMDRNWVTTKQSEPAGSKVDCVTEILLHAKKAGE